MRTLLITFLLLVAIRSVGQQITGTVFGERNQLIEHASVSVFQEGKLKADTTTDVNGNYILRPLTPGYYDVLVLHSGYDSFLMKQAVLSYQKMTRIHAKLEPSEKDQKCITTIWTEPLNYHGGIEGPIMPVRKNISDIPTVERRDLEILTPALYNDGNHVKPMTMPVLPTHTSHFRQILKRILSFFSVSK